MKKKTATRHKPMTAKQRAKMREDYLALSPELQDLVDRIREALLAAVKSDSK